MPTRLGEEGAERECSCSAYFMFVIVMQELITKYLCHEDDVDETKIFYKKMKGDYIRYMVEVCEDDKKSGIVLITVQVFQRKDLFRLSCAPHYVMNPPPPTTL